jgi:hypothetical protein
MFSMTSSIHAELISFWSEEGIINKTMLYDDFDAVVTGMAPLSQYAKQKKFAVYTQLDDALGIKGLVFFTIQFDKSGYPESGWNIPLDNLLEVAGLGPDLGKGPIRLVCRSQCPISWHAPRLWNPTMEVGSNTFNQIQKALPDACSRLGIRPSKIATAASGAKSLGSLSFTATGIPVLTDEALEAGKSSNIHQPEKQKKILELEQKIQDLNLQLQATLSEKEEQLNLQAYVHQQQLEILQTQNMKLVEQQKNIKNKYDTQKERLEALTGQVSSLSGIEESLRQERTIHQKQLQELQQSLSSAGEQKQQIAALLANKDEEYQTRIGRLKKEHLLTLDRRLEEEASRYLLSLKSLNAEINELNETISELEEQLQSSKREHTQDQESSADKFLLQLESIGMNFVVYHAGVGNLSVPVADLVSYLQNPFVYVAKKCLVSEAHYRQWLQHYENPRCSAPIGEGQCCQARLIRTDSPSRFVIGQSDRCARHQGADTAIINVLKFN